jgi:prepilin-type N-terminal cleavage/methylation domain-containing protein
MRPEPSPSAAGPRRQAGFTLVELLVSLAVTVILLLGVMATFDLNGRVTKVQTNVADMQQSLRIAQDEVIRTVRMAGRGGLPFADPPSSLIPLGVAVSVRDNVADNQLMVAGEEKTRILPGTDVLTVRGVLSTTLYQANASGALTLSPKVNPTRGTLTISDVSPGGVAQDLTPLRDAIKPETATPEAIVLVSTLDDAIHAVVELVPEESVNNGSSVTLAFRVSGSTRSNAYGKLSSAGTFPSALQNVAYAGIVEEYRYYVREEHAVAGDRTSDLIPKLARARFYPGTDTPYKADPAGKDVEGNARVDLADNILDFQVALGFDSANGGARKDDADNVGTDDQILETADGKDDDWLLNGSTDKPADAVWQGPPSPSLQYVRVTTLARTDRRDSQYQAPLLSRIEDHTYATSDAANSSSSRMFRWRLLQTVIDVRNL